MTDLLRLGHMKDSFVALHTVVCMPFMHGVTSVASTVERGGVGGGASSSSSRRREKSKKVETTDKKLHRQEDQNHKSPHLKKKFGELILPGEWS
jgi:hypothetical protein